MVQIEHGRHGKLINDLQLEKESEYEYHETVEGAMKTTKGFQVRQTRLRKPAEDRFRKFVGAEEIAKEYVAAVLPARQKRTAKASDVQREKHKR